MSIYFTEDHEWIKVDGDTGIVGISTYAAKALGDVVFVDLPEVGAEFDKGDEAGAVDSVKAASEIYTPVTGEVTEVNELLVDEPAKVNEDPMGEAWFFKVKISDASELDGLMDEAKYKAYLEDM